MPHIHGTRVSIAIAATLLSIVSRPSRSQTTPACEPAVGPRGQPFNLSSKGELNSRVATQVVMLRDTATGRTRGFVLVERGKDHWRGDVQRNEGSQRVSPSGQNVTGTTSVMIGGPPVTYALGPDSAVVRFMGKTYALADGNILLMDRVDEKDQTTVQVGGCVALADERTALPMVLRIPAVSAFVGPRTGGGGPNSRG